MFPGPIVKEALQMLEESVDTLARHIPKPLYLGTVSKGHFRYTERSSQVVQVLKAVRVVSGFNAAVILIQVGHHQEAGTILRVVNEALQDIDMLDEAHSNPEGPTEYQRKFVEEFFASDDARRTTEILEGQAQPIPRVPRKKKLASIVRRLLPAAKGRPVRQAVSAIDAVLDGYVHCGYAQVMELYRISDSAESFAMRGVADPRRSAMFSQWFSMFVHHGLNCVAKLLYDTKYESDADHLLDIRNRLEASPEYKGDDIV